MRNLADGSVEIYAEGDESPLNQLIEWCHAGPSEAVVEEVSSEWVPAEGWHRGFMRR